jgi:DUF4097 and DUF4098 domain-containing protein YvlB
MRRLFVVFSLVVGGLLPAVTAQADGAGQQTFSATGVNTLHLQVENGNIVVNAVDEPTIVINNALTDGFVAATVQQTGSTLAGDIANPGGDVTVQVPLGLALDLQTANGNITLSGTQGPLNLTANGGNITVQGGGSPQPTDLQAQNGILRLSGYSGGGTLANSNGDINVTLPSGAGAQFSLTTANSQIAVSGTAQSSDQVTTSLGPGGSLFTIQDSNGSIAVQ